MLGLLQALRLYGITEECRFKNQAGHFSIYQNFHRSMLDAEIADVRVFCF